MVKGKAWFRIKDPPAGEGQVGQKQHKGRLHPRFLRFLSPTRGTEGVVKTFILYSPTSQDTSSLTPSVHLQEYDLLLSLILLLSTRI